MNIHTPSPPTLADVLQLVEATVLSATRRRDMISSIRRICEMMGCAPQSLTASVPELRLRLANIIPAAHGVSPKTFSNVKSLFVSALEIAQITDPRYAGLANKDTDWGPRMKVIANDKRKTCGLAAFTNWCAENHIRPEAVMDHHVQKFHNWLETRTLCPRPRDVVRRTPAIWNKAAREIPAWPQIRLTLLSFQHPREHLSWDELHPDLHRDAERYLTAREKPDLFDECPNAPRRPLAKTTLRQQSEHLRLGASVLVRSGTAVEDITRLADLTEPEAFKIILRHYYDKADGAPNAFAVGVAKTLQQVARYHVGASQEELDRLKALAAKLPPVPFDLTEKNRKLLRQLESDQMQARLVDLPLDLLAEVRDGLDDSPLRFVDAQVAVAVDIALIGPLRPQNLSSLNWSRHFQEPQGRKGPLRLYIPKHETKTKQRDLVFELPDDVADRVRWYRRHILPRLDADPHGDLFVTHGGTRKDQKTFACQIIQRIEHRVGLHMTPHQFRHVAAFFYLRAHPEDFRTVTDLLGHSLAKTTLIYAGVSSERASRVYSEFVVEQRKVLKFKRRRRRNAKRAKRKLP